MTRYVLTTKRPDLPEGHRRKGQVHFGQALRDGRVMPRLDSREATIYGHKPVVPGGPMEWQVKAIHG